MSVSAAGMALRGMRVQLKLGFRDVESRSSKIAAREHDRRYFISHSRLCKIENTQTIPSPFKIFTLAAIYGVAFEDILGLYGVNPDRTHGYRAAFKLGTTHPVSAEVCRPDTAVTIPMRLDPSFKWDTTQLVNRAVALWGEIPAAFLLDLNPRKHMYAYIGLEDDTMSPILRPGSLVMIDEHRRRVQTGEWRTEYERPIYFIELRDCFLCGWCEVKHSSITVVPHPTSTMPLRTFSLTNEAEVVGQVVSVAMRLVPLSFPNQAPDIAVQALSSSAR